MLARRCPRYSTTTEHERTQEAYQKEDDKEYRSRKEHATEHEAAGACASVLCPA